MSSKLKIGLIGYGAVGQAFYTLIQEQYQDDFEIVFIGVKRSLNQRKAPKELFKTSFENWIDLSKIDLLIELSSDAEAALEWVYAALSKHIPVVSANKKLVAEHGDKIREWEERFQTSCRYEAAVCASIPILESLDSYFGHEPIEQISGVFNGSSNFILSSIRKNKLSYKESLKIAQELGYAEADPSYDVKGWDSRYKLSILIKHAFGEALSPDEIPCFGIDQLGEDAFRFARFPFSADDKLSQQRIRLIAHAAKTEKGISAWVGPCLVDENSAFFSVDDALNAVQIKTRNSGRQTFTGKGAGGTPTASAVLNDVFRLLEKGAYQLPKATAEKSPKHKVSWNVALSIPKKIPVDESLFNQLVGVWKHNTGTEVLGNIDLEALLKITEAYPEISVLKCDDEEQEASVQNWSALPYPLIEFKN